MDNISSPQQQQRTQNPALALYLLLGYSLLLLAGLGSQQNLGIDLLLAVIAYGGGRVYCTACAPEPHWGIQIFWLASLFMVLVPGVVQLSSGNFYWPLPGVAYATAEATPACFILGLGVLLTDWVYLGLIRAKTRQAALPIIAQEGAKSVRAFIWLSGLGVAWTVALLAALGPWFFLRTRGLLEADLASQFSLPMLGLIFTLGRGLLATLLVLGIDCLKPPLPVKTRQWVYRWLWVIGACNFVVNFPGAQARYPLLATLLMMGLTYIWRTPYAASTNRWLAWGFAPVLYGVVRLLGIFNRDTVFDLMSGLKAIIDLSATLRHGDFDGLQMTIFGVRYALAHGHTWGQQVLAAVLFFIPRGWWTTKGVPTGSLLAAHETFTYTNLSAPWPLECWLDFAWPGLIAGSALAGWLLYCADRTLSLPRARTPLAWLALIAFTPILLRGALLAVISPVAAVLFWLALARWLGGPKHAAKQSNSVP